MDQLEHLFPRSGGSAPLGLHVGNMPINEVLASMMALIRQQQAEICGLRDETNQRFQATTQRIDHNEAVLGALSNDLRFSQRPVSCYGQPPMPTMADCVTNVEYRLTLMENREKKSLSQQMAVRTEKQLLLPFFRRWRAVHAAHRAQRLVWKSYRKSVFSHYLGKWAQFVKCRHTALANARHVSNLCLLTDRTTRGRFFSNWAAVTVQRREQRMRRLSTAQECAEVLLKLTSRGIARRYFLKWTDMQKENQIARARWEAAQLLEQKTARTLAKGYLEQWLEYSRWQNVVRVREQVIVAQATQNYRSLANRYIDKWMEYMYVQQRERRVNQLVRQYRHMHLAGIARRYFAKLRQFAILRAEERRLQLQHDIIAKLSDRCDGLSMQLGMGLKTLAHTNSVLARVVDAVMLSDDVPAELFEQAAAAAHPSRAGHGRDAPGSGNDVQMMVKAILTDDAMWAKQAALQLGGSGMYSDDPQPPPAPPPRSELTPGESSRRFADSYGVSLKEHLMGASGEPLVGGMKLDRAGSGQRHGSGLHGVPSSTGDSRGASRHLRSGLTADDLLRNLKSRLGQGSRVGSRE